MRQVERENVAANAVADSLNSQYGWDLEASTWDDGSADRMHDFYLSGQGHQIALEVSTIADGLRVGRDVRWDSRAPGQLIPITDLEGVWIAKVKTEAEADDVIQAVTTHVPVLASLGLTSVDTRSWQNHWFTPPDGRPPEFAPILALSTAGVSDVSKIENASVATLREFGGKVQVLRAHGHTRRADRNYPLSFLNDQLAAPGPHASDIAKLEGVHATARHLWLWVELHEGLPIRRSFATEGLPTADIDCATLDGLWLGWARSEGQVAGARWLRQDGWDEFGTGMNPFV